MHVEGLAHQSLLLRLIMIYSLSLTGDSQVVIDCILQHNVQHLVAETCCVARQHAVEQEVVKLCG